jgi:Mg/Co/Ni transporter MgtE
MNIKFNELKRKELSEETLSMNDDSLLNNLESISLSTINKYRKVSRMSEREFLLLLSDTIDSELITDRIAFINTHDYAEKMVQMPFYQVAASRLPAIFITLVLAGFIGFEISLFHDLLMENILMTSLLPLLISIVGVVGLQSSATTNRAITTGHLQMEIFGILRAMLLESAVSAIIGVVSGLLTFVACTLWNCSYLLGLVTGISVFLASIVSGALGCSAPIIYHSLGFDPASMAGPFETAVLDLLANLIYLGLSSIFLASSNEIK